MAEDFGVFFGEVDDGGGEFAFAGAAFDDEVDLWEGAGDFVGGDGGLVAAGVGGGEEERAGFWEDGGEEGRGGNADADSGEVVEVGVGEFGVFV